MVDIIEGYETEEQQVDAIKGWWKENGNTLIIAAVIGFAGLWGWRYYNSSLVTAQEDASQGYSDLVVKFEAQGVDAVRDDMKQFVKENESNSYGVLASLLLAKEAVKQKDLTLASSLLAELQSTNGYAPLNPVINLRLAHVQLQLGEFDEALKTAELVKEKAFAVKMNQLKGLVYLQQGDNVKAYNAFKLAVKKSTGRVDPLLQMQLDDLTLPVEKMVTAPVLDKK